MARCANECHAEDGDFFLIPHRREANHNNPYDWSRDGGTRWMGDRDTHLLTYLGIPAEERWSYINVWLAEKRTAIDDNVEYRRK
jgi:hypothetical protein